MDIAAYLTFCPADSLFYDVPEHTGGRFEKTDAEPPAGWVRRSDAEWVNFLPPEKIPAQGWKVHVSATPSNAAEVLDVCWDFCTTRGFAFKFLKGTTIVLLRSGKYGDRAASGKFVTIYPRDEAELTEVLTELAPLLDGVQGPAILSDLRWRKGPLYVRYGGFQVRPMRTETGEQTWGIENDKGVLVPDDRRPGFHTPEWVSIPSILQEAIAERSRGRLNDFPYRPTQAMHFSNGGGVYRGVDASEREVLLKEARPLAGLDGEGNDAVSRLERERWACDTLSGVPQIPELFDYRIGHEHYFLVREMVDGDPLRALVVQRNPLLRSGASTTDYDEYSRWALTMLDDVERGLEEMHARGVIFGDLHPGNILVSADGSVHFIDLESAMPVDSDEPQSMGAPGYIAPPTFRGSEIDRYGFSVMMLDLFTPMARMINWEAGKLEALLDLIEERFSVPDDFRGRVLDGLQLEKTRAAIQNEELAPLSTLTDLKGPTPWPATNEGMPDWTETAARVAEGILATATPERADRLYPGDPPQLVEPQGGLTFTHGAAGVLWALHACGHSVPDKHEAWFREAVDTAQWARPGFGDGLAGAAYTLHALGHHGDARDAMLKAAELTDEWTPRGLFGGRAGLALALMDLGEKTSDDELVGAAELIARPLLAPPVEARPREPGLANGYTGEALVCVRRFERTGDSALLDLAEDYLRRDLAALEWSPEDTRSPAVVHMPYFGFGCGGIAVVADALLAHRESTDLRAFRTAVQAASDVPLSEEAGLLSGHAGLIMTTRHLTLDGDRPDREAMVRHAQALSLHCVGFRGLPVPVGTFNLRLSTDLGTGAAGVLLALSTLDQDVRFPLL